MTGAPIALEGLHNFRDLGGHATTDGRQVRLGRVYRSDALHRMTEADVAGVRALGVVSVVDLRAPDEIAHVGTGRIEDLGARYHNLPTRPAVLGADAPEGTPVPAPERYLGYLAEGPGCFVGLVTLLADPAATPVVFFCNAGKDRTGVAAAMVLGVLGVPDETVAADYARTQDALDAIHAVSRRDYPSDVRAWRNLSPDMATARAETMLAFLRLLRERHGGWSPYLASLGADPGTIAAMRESLLAPGPDQETSP
ncbi:MAG: tyrosine-protein phosphatase [Actinomycetota bacterium]